jgi:hypothetical protein
LRTTAVAAASSALRDRCVGVGLGDGVTPAGVALTGGRVAPASVLPDPPQALTAAMTASSPPQIRNPQRIAAI